MVNVRLTRAEQQQKTRHRLLEAAAASFAEQGFEGATIDAITERAGFTRGAFYSNFASKAELLIALSQERMAAVAADLFPKLETVSGEEQIREASHWLTTQAPPIELLLLVELGRVRDDNPEADEVVQRFVESAREFIQQALQIATEVDAADQARTDTITTALLAAIMGTQLLRHLDIAVSEDALAALLSGAFLPVDGSGGTP